VFPAFIAIILGFIHSREGHLLMPRIHRSAEPRFLPPPSLDRTFSVELASLSTDTSECVHAMFAPVHYEPRYAYPVLVWLHGCGGDERQLQRVMPLVSMRNYVAVAPRGVDLPAEETQQQIETAQPTAAQPETCQGQAGRPACYGWLQTDEHIAEAEQRVFDCVDRAGRRYHIAPERVFLMGFDHGGTMALRIAFNHPDRFAGAISLGGSLPAGHAPLGNLVAARRLGVFLAAGRHSRQYSADQVCADLRLLHTAGLSITLRQYPCGHELTPQMLGDVDRWIIEQIAPPRSDVVASDAAWAGDADG
jgi:phospholipase/carboxylesterase